MLQRVLGVCVASVWLISCIKGDQSQSEGLIEDIHTVVSDDAAVSEQSFFKNDGDTIWVTYNTRQGDSMVKQTDTHYFKSGLEAVYLVGNAKLESSRNQLNARRFDVCLDSFGVSHCGDAIEAPRYREVGIKEITYSGNTINISVNVFSNCCYSFIGDIGVQNDSTINLINIPYGQNHCACNCIFTINYSIKSNCMRNDESGNKLKALVINGNSKTMVKIASSPNESR